MFSFWFVLLALVVCCQIASFLFAASSKWSWRPIWSWSDHTKVQKGPVHQGITFSSSTMIHVFQSICFGCKQTKLNFRRSGSSWQRTTWVTLSSASVQTTTLLNPPLRLASTGSPPLFTPEPKLLFRYLLEQSNGVGPRYFPGPGNRVFETQYQVGNIFFETQYQVGNIFCWKLIFLLSAAEGSDLCPMCFPMAVHCSQQLGWALSFVVVRFSTQNSHFCVFAGFVFQ